MRADELYAIFGSVFVKVSGFDQTGELRAAKQAYAILEMKQRSLMILVLAFCPNFVEFDYESVFSYTN